LWDFFFHFCPEPESIFLLQNSLCTKVTLLFKALLFCFPQITSTLFWKTFMSWINYKLEMYRYRVHVPAVFFYILTPPCPVVFTILVNIVVTDTISVFAVLFVCSFKREWFFFYHLT
jgi:hypothetical protein